MVFEGADGVGKTTQVTLAADYLFKKHQLTVLLTKEPTPECRGALEMLGNTADPMECAKLFVEDRAQHIKSVILPALRSGWVVLCDRYWHSTLVYQEAQGAAKSDLRALHSGIELVVPDLTVWLDCSWETASARLEKRGKRDQFEKDKRLQELVHRSYRELFKPEGEAWLSCCRVDASQAAQDVARDVANALESSLSFKEAIQKQFHKNSRNNLLLNGTQTAKGGHLHEDK